MKYAMMDLILSTEEISALGEDDERYAAVAKHLDAALLEAVHQGLIDEEDI